MSHLGPSLQAFFTDRLLTQRQASPNTIAAYRHTFQLLLRFATDRTGTPPSELDITQLDAPLIASFLDHLEHDRGNTIQTRNNRLAAIHSLFAYLALHHPEHADTIGRVLAIPHKRTTKNLLTYLTDPEVNALLATCDQSTWTGRRDHAMLALTIQTGLRISELVALTCQDITLDTGANVHTIGKGRKARRTPLTPPIRRILTAWSKERAGNLRDPLFPTRTGHTLSRDALERRLAGYLRRDGQLPIPRAKAREHARAPAFRRHAPATGRYRHGGDRALARPRTDRNDPDLPARGHDPQAESDRSHQADQRQTRPLPPL